MKINMDYVTGKQKVILRMLRDSKEKKLYMKDIRDEVEKHYPVKDPRSLYKTLRSMENNHLILRDTSDKPRERVVVLTEEASKYIKALT